jgi:hypothetical protein
MEAGRRIGERIMAAMPGRGSASTEGCGHIIHDSRVEHSEADYAILDAARPSATNVENRREPRRSLSSPQKKRCVRPDGLPEVSTGNDWAKARLKRHSWQP